MHAAPHKASRYSAHQLKLRQPDTLSLISFLLPQTAHSSQSRQRAAKSSIACSRLGDIPALGPRQELRTLLNEEVEVLELFSVFPKAN